MPKERRRSTSSDSSSSSSSENDDRKKRHIRSKLAKLETKLCRAKRKGETKAPNGITLSGEDYFRKQAPFRLWVATEKHATTDGVSTDKVKLLFCNFAKKWNSGRLKSKYYENISSTQCDPSTRTSYKWGFINQMDDVTKMALSTARDTADTNTHERKWKTVAPGGKKGSSFGGKGGKGMKSTNCTSCAGPWPCRNLDCPKGRPDRKSTQESSRSRPQQSTSSRRERSPPTESTGNTSITIFDE